MPDGKVILEIDAKDSGAKKELQNVEDAAQDMGDAAQDAAGGMDDLGDSTGKAAKEFGTADVALGSLIANGLTALASKAIEVAGNLLSLADETREYREDMAKLETAFTTNGHSAETASKIYEDFYAILGESDRSVEAVNHLAELTQSEADLAKWSDIAAGVTAKFGDSLPIEGLTEAANESAKVGAVVGPLADAINWATISNEQWNEVLGEGTPQQEAFAKAIEEGATKEDAYSAALAACATEQDRATLITNTLNTAYSDAADAYNEATKEQQEARRATSELEAAQADLGAALEPVTTAWTRMKAEGMQWLVDVGLPAIKKGFAWVSDNLPGIAAVVGTLAAAWLTFGGALKLVEMWTKLVAAAQAVQNAVMAANPIGLIVIAIGALVAAFILLWNNCEAFREFWIGLWENIKAAFDFAWQGIANFFTVTIPELFNGAVEWFTSLYDAVVDFFTVQIPGAFQEFVDAVVGFFQQWWENLLDFYTVKIPEFFNGVVEWFKQLPERIAFEIGVIIGHIIQFGIDLWKFATTEIPKFINKVVEFFKTLPGKIWEWLKNAIQKVTEWGAETVRLGIEKATEFVNKVVEFFATLPGRVWEWLNTAIQKVIQWGSDTVRIGIEKATEFVNKVIEWVSTLPARVWDWLSQTVQKVVKFGSDLATKGAEAAKGLFDSIINGIKALPEKVMEIGSNIVQGLWNGISSGWSWLTDKVSRLASSLLDGVKSVLKIKSPSKAFAYVGDMSAKGIEVGFEDNIPEVQKTFAAKAKNLVGTVQASINAENARFARGTGTQDNGFGELARAVGTQTAGINSLAGMYRRGNANMRPIVLELNGRELGRAVVDVGNAEISRVGMTPALVGG